MSDASNSEEGPGKRLFGWASGAAGAVAVALATAWVLDSCGPQEDLPAYSYEMRGAEIRCDIELPWSRLADEGWQRNLSGAGLATDADRSVSAAVVSAAVQGLLVGVVLERGEPMKSYHCAVTQSDNESEVSIYKRAGAEGEACVQIYGRNNFMPSRSFSSFCCLVQGQLLCR